jgi:hypothetical protein
MMAEYMVAVAADTISASMKRLNTHVLEESSPA